MLNLRVLTRTGNETSRLPAGWVRAWAGAALLLCCASAASCGKTHSGDSVDHGDGDPSSGSTSSSADAGNSTGATGNVGGRGPTGTAGDSAVGSAGGSDAGAAAGGGGFGPGGTGVGGYGTGGTGAGGFGAGGLGAGGAPICDVPAVPPDPNPTEADAERAALIHAFCVTLSRDGCLERSFIGGDTTGCSADQRVVACELDQLSEYLGSVTPECAETWKTAIRCAADASYPGVSECGSAGLGNFVPGTVVLCQTEKEAFSQCSNAHSPWHPVTGSRTTCEYGPGITSTCGVSCQGDNDFWMECGGPAGIPMRCTCNVNGVALGDSDFVLGEPFYASSCEDAARRAANGTCTNRLDCCFEYEDTGKTECLCGSDPNRLGQPTCEALAASVDGRVVNVCPKYEPDDGSCWPPPCAQ